MSRVFWVTVGAVGGVMAYRRGVAAMHTARERGALGTVQAAASTTSRVAGRTATGLGRLQDLRARRSGHLVIGSAEEVVELRDPRLARIPVPAGRLVIDDEDWVPSARPAHPDAPGVTRLGTARRA